MRTAVTLLSLAIGMLALAGCGGDGSSQPVGTTATATAAADTTPTGTSAPVETTAAPSARTIVVTVRRGRPQGGIQRPTVRKGEKVVLVIRTDAGEQVHLHGYDLERDVAPGTPVRIPFTASLPGRFELELHHPDALLAVIEVRP